MKIYEVLPERIVAQEGVKNETRLLSPATMQIGIGREETAEIARGGYIVLDYGREIVGGVRLISYFSEQNVPVRLRFGESVAEVYAELGEKNATNDHALRDFRLSLPQLSDGVYGDTGFRFLRIDAEGSVFLKAAVAVDKRADLPITGNFTCSDPRVDEIYKTARETLLCCVQNGYIWDGVKRDRLVWIGDLHPELMGLLSLTRSAESVVNCLRIAVEQTPLPGWMNGIPCYSLWWIVDLHDYYSHTGDLAAVKEFSAYFTELLRQVDGYVGEDGSTHFSYDFLDWPTHGQEDEVAGQTGLVALAMEKAVTLSEVLGFSTPAAAILARVRKHRATVKKSKQAMAMRALAGFAGKEETAAFLARNGAEGMSSFMSYYILRALAECGRGAEALSMMKDYYGGMLDAGARTFWEDFSVGWKEGSGRIDALPKAGEKDIHGDFGAFCYVGFRHSLCHGWSCGPIPFLMHVVLGIRILEAGCKTVAVVPDLCGLSYAEGDLPTPYGVLHIEHRKTENGIQTKIDAPAGVKIVTSGKSLIS